MNRSLRVPKLSRWLAGVAVLAWLVAPGPAARAAGDFSLDFNQDGVLPSASGQDFVYQTYGSVPEASAFAVSGGLLHLDTTGYGDDVGAFYDFLGGYDHRFSAETVVRARVLSSGFQGLGFGFSDPVYSGIITVNRGGWGIYGLTGGVIADPDAFHEFALRAAAGTGAYEFLIDGAVVSSGTLPAGYPDQEVYFGDGTPTGGNVQVEIDYIRYSNPTTDIPEPGATQGNPILPDITTPGLFTFTNVPSGRWFDPPIVSGFTYTMTGGSLFSSILDFPTGFAGPFTVDVGGTILGSFGPGQSVDFSGFAGGGVSSFRVTGITPPVDAANPLAFPLQIAFTTPTASFTMQAINPQQTEIPEPGTLALLLVGGLTTGAGFRRPRRA